MRTCAAAKRRSRSATSAPTPFAKRASQASPEAEEGQRKQFSEVSAEEAIALTQDGLWLLDVREQDEWDRGHAPHARLVPMSQLPEGLEGVPIDQRVLVVCHAGSRSLRVTNALLDVGYEEVNVSGGMLAWKGAGGELVAEGADAPRVD